MTEKLTEDGALTDPRWAEALRATPRHPFVPSFYEQRLGENAWDMVTESSDPQRWAEGIYSDGTLTTAVRSHQDVFGGFPVPISSSTRPSLMVRMLELLDVADTHGVLEIGTGTGYNAALLCHRVGARRVTTVELHPDFAEAARARLSGLELHPTVVIGDGTDGVPYAAPYDRIIATCGVERVPGAWVSQLAEGGRIVVDLRSESSSRLVVLTKIGPQQVSGRFTGRPGYFMWMRPEADQPLRDPRLGAQVQARDDRTTSAMSWCTPTSWIGPACAR